MNNIKPNLRVRAHDFGILNAEELAPKIAHSGASCVQLALYQAQRRNHRRRTRSRNACLQFAEHARILIEEMNSLALGIIFDPTNLVPQKDVADMNVFLDKCFDAFGEHIIAVHAKGFCMEQGVNGLQKSGPIPAGTGKMDWFGVFRRLFKVGKQDVPILLEETGPGEAVEIFSRLTKYWERAANTNL